MTLVDTSVWSLVLRRRRSSARSVAEAAVVEEWRKLSVDSNAAMIGIVRQEVLSGIRDPAQFTRLQEALDTFPHLTTTLADHDRAAECFNVCRAAGVSGDPVDMLICASAMRHRVSILTVDSDFSLYARRLPIHLHSVG